MSTWLSAEDWRKVQASVPIACVDVLPVRPAKGTDAAARRFDSVGLILRDTPHQGRRWCLIGGRMFRNESFPQAVSRQLRETLGRGVTFDLPADVQPDFVAQYFTEPGPVGCLDPRQHAIGNTFVVPVAGTAHAQGEAHDFRWFPLDALPRPQEFGFDQDRVLAACLRVSRTEESL